MEFSKDSDFLIDSKWTFEIGGKNKTQQQIQNIDASFVVADNIEYASARRIPLWLFGFIY